MRDGKSFKGRSEMHHAYVRTRTVKDGCWNKSAKLATEQVNPNVCTEHSTKQEQNTHFFQMHMDQSPGYAVC